VKCIWYAKLDSNARKIARDGKIKLAINMGDGKY
jgi:hypothetical protein